MSVVSSGRIYSLSGWGLLRNGEAWQSLNLFSIAPSECSRFARSVTLREVLDSALYLSLRGRTVPRRVNGSVVGVRAANDFVGRRNAAHTSATTIQHRRSCRCGTDDVAVGVAR